MQVKSYCKKYQIPAQDVLESLTAQFGGTWLLNSQLNNQIVDFLNSNFGNQQPQLAESKKQLQLPQAKSVTETQIIATSKTELSVAIQERSESLTISDVQELQTQVQISEIEEQAVHHAVEAFQTYQDTYEEVTRSLILKDVYQRTVERDNRRKEFEEKQKQRKESQIKPEQSIDAKSEILGLIKADNYKSNYLNDILGGL